MSALRQLVEYCVAANPDYPGNREAEAELDAKETRIRQLEQDNKVLREGAKALRHDVCPFCGSVPALVGHEDDCELALALAGK